MSERIFGARPDQPELCELIDSCIDGTASEQDWQRLDQLLSADPSARQYYVAHLNLHAALLRKLGAAAVQELAEVAGDTLLPSADSGPALPPATIQQSVRRAATFLARPTPLSVAIAAASLLLLLLAFAIIPVSFRAAPPDAPQVVDAAGPVAEIVELSDAQWEAGGPTAIVGDVLHGGQTVALRSGMASIRFDSGAQIVLEGPAELQIDTRNSARLGRGRLTASVPSSATGYALSVKQFVITDLGTRFGVVAGEDLTQVHVFRGRVAVNSAAAPSTDGQILQAGMAAQFDDQGVVTSRYPAAEQTFEYAAALAGATEAQVRGEIRYLIHPPQSLAAGGELENNKFAHLIPEQRDVALPRDVSALLVKPAAAGAAALESGELPAGTRVTSYLLHFDIQENPQREISQRTGVIEFDRPILAVILDDDQLAATDVALGIADVPYDSDPEARKTRGLELDVLDKVVISPDQRRLLVTCALGTEATDQVRILISADEP